MLERTSRHHFAKLGAMSKISGVIVDISEPKDGSLTVILETAQGRIEGTAPEGLRRFIRVGEGATLQDGKVCAVGDAPEIGQEDP